MKVRSKIGKGISREPSSPLKVRLLIADGFEAEVLSKWLFGEAQAGESLEIETVDSLVGLGEKVSREEWDLVVLGNLSMFTKEDSLRLVTTLVKPSRAMTMVLAAGKKEEDALLRTGSLTEHAIFTVRRELLGRSRGVGQGILAALRLTRSRELTLKKAEKRARRLEKLSLTDDLTSLYNMRHMKKRISEEWTRARRRRDTLALVMIDVDNFKGVNDKSDHLMGSFVLAEIGRILRQNVRSTDVAGRYGGDEFIVLMPETSLASARLVMERVAKEVAQHEFSNGRHSVKVSVSVGVSAASPALLTNLEPEALLRHADEALFLAKRLGKNRVEGSECGAQAKEDGEQKNVKKAKKTAQPVFHKS